MNGEVKLPTILRAFCARCGRYVGLARACSCGWQSDGLAILPGRPFWQVEAPGPVLGRPVVGEAGGQKVAVTPWLRLDRDFAPEAGGLLALGLEDRRELWRWPPEGEGPPPADAAAVGAGLAFVGTADGVLRALRLESGEEVWQVALDGALRDAPLLDLRQELLFVATLAGSLYEVELQEGRGRPLPFQGEAGFVGGPFACQGLLVGVDERGEVWGVEREQGRVRWHFRAPEGGPQRTHLAVAGPRVYLATEAGQVYALSPGRERPEWVAALPAGVCAPPLVARDLLLVPSQDGRLTALSLEGGKEQWHFQAQKRVTGPGAAWQGLAFIGSHDKHIYALDARTGHEAWRLQVDGRVVGGVAVYEGMVLAGTLVLDEERQPIGGQVVALPWHLGQWAWAAGWAEEVGALDAAALFRALENEPEEALRLWRKAGREDLAGRLCESLGDDGQAARLYEEAGRRWRMQDPLRAARHFASASACYERAGCTREADECLRLARRLGGLPDLRIEPVNVPEFRQGEQGELSVRLVNDGAAEATEIALTVGSPEGGLAEPRTYQCDGSLKPGEKWLLTLEVVPTAEKARVVVEAEYKVAGLKQGSWHSRQEIPIKAVPPPVPLVEVKGDVGLVKVESEGQPAGGPVVRVQRDVGVIRTRKTGSSRREPEKPGGH
jgi:outer membrane protein assembly factor BamB